VSAKIPAVERRDERLRLAVQIWGEALHNPEDRRFLFESMDGLRSRMAGDLREAQHDGPSMTISIRPPRRASCSRSHRASWCSAPGTTTWTSGRSAPPAEPCCPERPSWTAS